MKIFFDANICLDLLDSTRPTSVDSIGINQYAKGTSRRVLVLLQLIL